jgi:hypothetical protein
MSGVGYNIPISVSLSAGSSADGPFADNTYVNFSGSTLESWQPNVSEPSNSTSATASASNGGPANASSNTQASSPAGAASPATVSSPVLASATGFSTTDYLLIGGLGLAIFLLRKHL